MLAMLTPRPIHIATDSRNAKNGIDKLLDYLKAQDLQDNDEDQYEEWPMGKHWSLLHDGDLWQQAWTILAQSGQASVRIMKVKEHARDRCTTFQRANGTETGE